jgi:hypothetical protein
MKSSTATNNFTNMLSSSYMNTIRDTIAPFEQSYYKNANDFKQKQESKCSGLFVGVGLYYNPPQSRQQPSAHAIVGASTPPLLANVQQPHKQTRLLTAINDTILDHDHDSNYHDHHLVPDIQKPLCTKGGVKLQFPVKLYHILEYIDLHEPELANIISWQPHGRCFQVHDAKKMEELILPRFFNTRHFPSFRRQMSFWGFTRLGLEGPDQGGYYHELFLRGKPYLCRNINRRSKATKRSAAEKCHREPDFYTMPVLPPSSVSVPCVTPSAATLSTTDVSSSPSASLVGGTMDLDAFTLPSSKYLPLEDGYGPVKRVEYSKPCDLHSSGSMPNKHQDKTTDRNGTIDEKGTSTLDSGRTLSTARFVRDWQREWQRYADQHNGVTTVSQQQDRDCCGRANKEKNTYPDDSSTAVDFSPVAIGCSFRLTEEEEEEMLDMLANIS